MMVLYTYNIDGGMYDIDFFSLSSYPPPPFFAFFNGRILMAFSSSMSFCIVIGSNRKSTVWKNVSCSVIRFPHRREEASA